MVTYSLSMLYAINWKVYSICKYTKKITKCTFFFSLPTESIGIGFKKKEHYYSNNEGCAGTDFSLCFVFIPWLPPIP